MGYGWKFSLIEAVPNGGTVSFPTPGVGNDDCMLDEATLAVHNEVILAEGFSVVADTVGEPVEGEPPPIETSTVTNAGENEWPAGAEIYLATPDKPPLTGDDATAAMAAMDARVSDLETRVTALEAPVTRSSRSSRTETV